MFSWNEMWELRDMIMSLDEPTRQMARDMLVNNKDKFDIAVMDGIIAQCRASIRNELEGNTIHLRDVFILDVSLRHLSLDIGGTEHERP